MVSTYLLNSRYLNELVNAVETDPKTLQRIEFTTQQMIDALSPANFFATNPEALETILQTQGQSLQKGIVNLLGDLGKGKVSQTDESGFEVGQNLAQTEGAVVYRNKLFELIQYKPLTDQVYERPFLMVPPCINKYYILDLQPDNSVVRYMVDDLGFPPQRLAATGFGEFQPVAQGDSAEARAQNRRIELKLTER